MGSSEWWTLPIFVEHPDRWVSCALAEWRQRAPSRFPGAGDWQSSPVWQTEAEIAAIGRLDEFEERRLAAERAYVQERTEMESQLSAATNAADQGERRLLTHQGGDLVAEVISTLREIGFNVTDVDETISAPGDRREDIRVADPTIPDWIAIGEVRGYVRGAQLNDLLRLARFVARFVRESGREPDRTWYIVNQFFALSPTERPRPLEANPAEVETFGEGGGTVIDTRDLFVLRMRVRRGELASEAARALLRQAGARLDLK